MSRSLEELWALLQEAHRMPYGAAQIAVIEQVIRHADALGDRELGYHPIRPADAALLNTSFLGLLGRAVPGEAQ